MTLDVRLLWECRMKKLYIAILSTFLFSDVFASGTNVVTIDFMHVVEESKIGAELRRRLKILMDNIRQKISKLETALKQGDVTEAKKKSYNAIFRSNFDIDAYMQSSDQDKHLMLYSLVQKLSNEVSVAAAEGEKNLKSKILTAVKEIAVEQKADLVLDKSSIAYASKNVVDITGDVIKKVDQDFGKFKFPDKLEDIK